MNYLYHILQSLPIYFTHIIHASNLLIFYFYPSPQRVPHKRSTSYTILYSPCGMPRYTTLLLSSVFCLSNLANASAALLSYFLSPSHIILDASPPEAPSKSMGTIAICIPLTTEWINLIKHGIRQGRNRIPATDQSTRNITLFHYAPSNNLSHHENCKIEFHFWTGTWATFLISAAKPLMVSP